MTPDLLQAIDELVPRTPRPSDWQDVLARAAVSRGNPPRIGVLSPREPRVSRAQRLRAGAAPRGGARTRIVLIAVAVVVIGGGTATALAIRALTQGPVTNGFSALNDPSLPRVSAGSGGVAPSVARFFDEQLGTGALAREVAPGLYLAQHGSDLCEAATRGAAGCTDHLTGDVWLFGDQIRAYDAETAPFNVHIYGFARDNVASIVITTADGATATLPVSHNAFQRTFRKMTFADIRAVQVISTSGRATSIDPRSYFPATPPNEQIPHH